MGEKNLMEEEHKSDSPPSSPEEKPNSPEHEENEKEINSESERADSDNEENSHAPDSPHDDQSDLQPDEESTQTELNTESEQKGSDSDEEEKKSEDSDVEDEEEKKRREEEELLQLFGISDDDDDSQADQNDSQNQEQSESDEDIDLEQTGKGQLEKLVQKKAAKPKKTRPTRGKKRKNPVTDEEALTEEMRPKKKKNPPGKRTEEELNGIILSFIDKMKTADQDDSFCMMNRKPATNRLKLLPEVQRYMANIEFQPYFIRYNILEDLAHWIAPREDKSLPNIRFREVILSILNQVQMEYLTSDTLRESGIGKMVYLYSVHSKETPQNKKLASSILNKWMRPLYGNTDDYEEPPERAPKVSRKRVKKPHRQLASFDNGDDDDDERSSYQHRIPQRQRFEFRINPQSNFSSEPSRRREPSQTQRSIDRQINLLKAKGRK